MWGAEELGEQETPPELSARAPERNAFMDMGEQIRRENREVIWITLA